MSEIDRLYHRFASDGDPEALAALYDRIAPELLLVATHYLGDASAAEDAVQTAFLAVIERRGRFDPSRPLRPWLLGAVTNQARLKRRADARRIDSRRVGPTGEADPGRLAEAEELVRAVGDSIARLPDTYRTVLDLRLRRGLAPHEIATRLDRPAGTVRSQLARGLAEVRRALPPGFAAAVTLLVASEAGVAGGRAATIAAAGTGGAGTATAVGAGAMPFKIGAVCFTIGLAVALPLVILAGKPETEGRSGSDPIGPRVLEAETFDPEPPGPTAGSRDAVLSAAAPARPEAEDPTSPAGATQAKGAWMLHGRVRRWVARLGAERPPIPNCRVEIYLRIASFDDGPRNRPFASLVTDREGRFRLDLEALRRLHPQDLDGAELIALAHIPGLVDQEWVEDFPEDPRRAYRGEVVLDLEPGALLSGRVVEPGGEPVGVGYVGTPDGDDTDAFEEAELVDGRYRLIVHERGSVRLRALVPGRAVSQDVVVPVRALEPIDVPDLILRPGATIDGLAVYPDGTPAQDLVLAYHRELRGLDSRWADHGKVITDRHGRFRLTDLERTPYRFEPDVDLDDRTGACLEPGPNRATLTVRSPVIVVRTVDADGRPRHKVPLRILGWRGAHADRARAVWSAGGDLGALRGEARHYQSWEVRRRSGIFSFAVPANSFWVVRAVLPGHRTVERAVRTIPGRFEHRIQLTIEPLRREARLRVAVRDADGRSLRRFFLTLAPAETGIAIPYLRARLVGSEREVRGLPPGRYRMALVPEQGLLRTAEDRAQRATLLPVTRVVKLAPGLNRVTVDTRRGARLAVRFHLPPGVESRKIPIGELEIVGPGGVRRVRCIQLLRLSAEGHLRRRTSFPARGELIPSHRFRPGTRKVRFLFEGYAPAEAQVSFEAGRLHRIELRLFPAPDGKRSSIRAVRVPRAPRR